MGQIFAQSGHPVHNTNEGIQKLETFWYPVPIGRMKGVWMPTSEMPICWHEDDKVDFIWPTPDSPPAGDMRPSIIILLFSAKEV
jgi:hypothetical protein